GRHSSRRSVVRPATPRDTQWKITIVTPDGESRCRVPKRIHRSSRARFFLVVGGGYPNKNHVTAVSAFAKAFPFSEDICLLVIQRRRTLPKELRRLLRRLRFDSRIQVRRDVRNDELVALYNRAEALVFP